MPEGGVRRLRLPAARASSLLSFEEITAPGALFVAHGVRKIRLTGGEPLLRKDVERLIGDAAALRTPDGRRSTSPHHQRRRCWRARPQA
jgi:molybdenum cofactor biosynthesis enzyme MoaA